MDTLNSELKQKFIATETKGRGGGSVARGDLGSNIFTLSVNHNEELMKAFVRIPSH